nr:hypothetical protein [Vibrio splendidus]MCC4883008.1 hypothetical protein [Vibrio splendidus]
MQVLKRQVEADSLISCPCCSKPALMAGFDDSQLSEHYVACPSCRFMVYQYSDSYEYQAPFSSRVTAWGYILRSWGFSSLSDARLGLKGIELKGVTSFDFSLFDTCQFQFLGGLNPFYAMNAKFANSAYYDQYPTSKQINKYQQEQLQSALSRTEEPLFPLLLSGNASVDMEVPF